MEGVPQGYTIEEAVMHLPADNAQHVTRRLVRVCEMLRRQRDVCADGERRAMAALDQWQNTSGRGRCGPSPPRRTTKAAAATCTGGQPSWGTVRQVQKWSPHTAPLPKSSGCAVFAVRLRFRATNARALTGRVRGWCLRGLLAEGARATGTATVTSRAARVHRARACR